MSLVSWPAPGDNFNHTDLANNFSKIDSHDHTSGKGTQIPPGGIANLSINTPQIADLSVTDGKISATSPITDGKLASANNSTYKTIYILSSKASSAMSGTGSWFFGEGGNFVQPSVASSTTMVPVFYLNVSDVTVSNKSPFLQVITSMATNNVAPGVSFTVGLNLVSVDPANATSGNIAYIAGSQIASSTATIITPAQNTMSEQASIDFAFPATGFYTLAMNMSGTPGAGAVIAVSSRLRIRHT